MDFRLDWSKTAKEFSVKLAENLLVDTKHTFQLFG